MLLAPKRTAVLSSLLSVTALSLAACSGASAPPAVGSSVLSPAGLTPQSAFSTPRLQPSALAAGSYAPAPPTRASRATVPLSPLARAGKGLLYWGDYNNNTVTIFSSKGVNPPVLGTITNGISNPERLFVDRKANLWVSNIGTATIAEYPPGTTSPSFTISSGVDRPTGLTVDREGTVYVANVGNDTVTVYKKGQTSPSLTIQLQYQPEDFAVDTSDNLYVAYLSASKSGVMEFPPGSTSGHDLGLDVGGIGVNAIEVDRSGNIILANDSVQSIDVFAPGQTEPTTKVPVNGLPFQLSLNKDESVLYATVETSSAAFIVQTLKYPGGTSLSNKNTEGSGVWPIAVSPDNVL